MELKDVIQKCREFKSGGRGEELCYKSGVSFSWLRALVEGRMKSPGYEKIQGVITAIKEMEGK